MFDRGPARASEPQTLTSGALAILKTADPMAKAAMSAAVAARWRSGNMAPGEPLIPPFHPARPPRPALRPPREMVRRRGGGGIAGRVALLHAIAHIELNAIDLAWDLIARFPSPGSGFHDDWVRVAAEEAVHFQLVSDRLAVFGAGYGDLPAHDGLWEAAAATAGDLMARLSVVPMVLEARGLDVTPAMMERLVRAGDHDSAKVLQRIYLDEIGHVDIGRKWFVFLCDAISVEPASTWRNLVRLHYRGALKRPFNTSARAAAGMPGSLYEPLADALT